MKVVIDIAGYSWDILANGKKIAHIKTESGYRWTKKKLYIGDKFICDTKNKQDAIDQLDKFICQNKKDIKEIKNDISALEKDLAHVNHSESKRAIEKIIIQKKELLDNMITWDVL